MNPSKDVERTRIGFMQGRLSPIRNNRIQSFPWGAWSTEFAIAHSLNLPMMEWTIDSERFDENPLITSEGQKVIRSLLNIHELTIPSVTCDYFMENPFWTAGRYESKKTLTKIIEGMSSINARYLVIPLVDSSSLPETLESEAKDFFFELAEILEKNNVLIAFESDFAPKKLGEFISDFDSQFFGINYDMGNSASLSFVPEEEFAAYGDRIINVHVKDRIRFGTTVPLGTGDTDFRSVFLGLKNLSYEGNYILQAARDQNGKHAEAVEMYANFVANLMRSTLGD
jgi:L-ribulose-5-phosphate 3-epimerase